MFKFKNTLVSLSKPVISLLIVGAALYAGWQLWQAYVLSPWTRDAKVSAQVVRIAPEVSGTIEQVLITDNQYVEQGQRLYQIDPKRYQIALAHAQAQYAVAQESWREKRADAKRRRSMHGLVAEEEIQRAEHAEQMARAHMALAKADVDLAQLNLQRTELRAPVAGFITHMRLHQGDYASAGTPNLAIVDANSFVVLGYFEETKLQGIRLGQPAQIKLMGFEQPITGHVSSIGRGITDQNQDLDEYGLPRVNPNFSWIRLAQRIPVRISLDQVPEVILLSAGMTASVQLEQKNQHPRLLSWLYVRM